MSESDYYWKQRKGGELVALFRMSVGTHNLVVPYSVPELKRIASSMDRDSNKEGIFPHQAQDALDTMDDFCAKNCPGLAAE